MTGEEVARKRKEIEGRTGKDLWQKEGKKERGKSRARRSCPGKQKRMYLQACPGGSVKKVEGWPRETRLDALYPYDAAYKHG
jgi:hypothetical protein